MPALPIYRQMLARALKGYPIDDIAGSGYSGTATSGSTTSILEDTAWPHLTAISRDDTLEGALLFRPNAAAVGDKVRQVGIGSYVASTGKSTVDKTYTTAPYAGGVGEKYEYHTHGFEPLIGMQFIINEALKRIMVPVEVVFTPRSNTDVQDVTTTSTIGGEPQGFSWLTEPWQVLRVRRFGESGTQQQTITQSGSPTGGTFAISYRGTQSSLVAYNASAATLQTALRAMPYLGAVTVTRTGTTTNFVWTVTMQDVVGPSPLLTMDSAFNSMTGGSSPTLAFAQSRAQGWAQDLRGKPEKNGAVLELHLTEQFNSGDTTLDRISIRAWKPAYQHCRATSTGAFGDIAGLTAEAHEAVPEFEYVVAAALVYCFAQYPQTQSGFTEKQRIDNLTAAQDALGAWRSAYTQRENRTFRPIGTAPSAR